MTHSIVNLDQLEFHPLPEGIAASGAAAERYAPRVAMLGMQLGARKLGYNVIALPPGKRGFPFHNHLINEEMFLILEGTGEIRIGEARHSLRPGDVIACPTGGAETAHQIINTGSGELRYLALSTKFSPDVIEYPDSGTYRIIVDADGEQPGFDAIGRQVQSVPYWDGE